MSRHRGWTLPRAESHKLNASRFEWYNKATVGGVIRDDKVKIDSAFQCATQNVPILLAE